MIISVIFARYRDDNYILTYSSGWLTQQELFYGAHLTLVGLPHIQWLQIVIWEMEWWIFIWKPNLSPCSMTYKRVPPSRPVPCISESSFGVVGFNFLRAHFKMWLDEVWLWQQLGGALGLLWVGAQDCYTPCSHLTAPQNEAVSWPKLRSSLFEKQCSR